MSARDLSVGPLPDSGIACASRIRDRGSQHKSGNILDADFTESPNQNRQIATSVSTTCRACQKLERTEKAQQRQKSRIGHVLVTLAIPPNLTLLVQFLSK
jgi:hypothetical protein